MPKAIYERDLYAPEDWDALPEPNRLYIYCPGCYADVKEHEPDAGERWWINCAVHCIDSRWAFNGNLDKPTFRASLLVQGVRVCHSYITDGKIQYLGDCTHALKNQTVELMDVDESMTYRAKIDRQHGETL